MAVLAIELIQISQRETELVYYIKSQQFKPKLSHLSPDLCLKRPADIQFWISDDVIKTHEEDQRRINIRILFAALTF